MEILVEDFDFYVLIFMCFFVSMDEDLGMGPKIF